MANRLCMSLIIFVALALRLRGISWGLPSSELPLAPLHPDEIWAMTVLSQMNWPLGDFNPEMGHREGALAYYIWTGFGQILKWLGILNKMPWEVASYDSNYGNFLLAARLLTVLLDVASCVFVYLSVLRSIHKNMPALLAGLILSVIPFEVIYSHYVRTHAVSNFFLSATIYFSLTLYDKVNALKLIGLGAISGMAAATRYPLGSCLLIPGCIVLGHGLTSLRKATSQSIGKITVVMGMKCLFLALGFLVAFIICDPYLIFDFESAKPHLKDQAAFVDKDEFSWSSFFSMHKIWVYLSYLLPHGTTPLLAAVLYAAAFYVMLRRGRIRYSVPLMIFVLIYFYSMAKGYTTELVFIRPTMAMFPPLSVLVGLAVGDILVRYPTALIRRSLAFASGLVVLLTASYTWAYVSAMDRTDPRVQLYSWLRDNDGRDRITVGAFPYCRNFIVMFPALDALQKPRVTYDLRDDLKENPKDADYVVLAAYEPDQFALAERRVVEFSRSGNYELSAKFETPVTFGDLVFDNSSYPHDFQYPFPKLYILKRTNR